MRPGGGVSGLVDGWREGGEMCDVRLAREVLVGSLGLAD
jgi:hypothetical protein